MNKWSETLGSWERVLIDILYNNEVTDSLNKINRMYNQDSLIIYPAQENVFRSFKECPYEKLSVVIILQDPYHDGSATGIGLGNEPGNRLSPSLRIVKDKVSETIYNREEFNFDPTMKKWANQGILLFNTALTVERGKPGSHQLLWEPFTKKLLVKLSEINSGIIYCLWGKHAISYQQYINNDSNSVLIATHPVYSVYRGEPWECNHFSHINKQLKEFNNLTINW